MSYSKLYSIIMVLALVLVVPLVATTPNNDFLNWVFATPQNETYTYTPNLEIKLVTSWNSSGIIEQVTAIHNLTQDSNITANNTNDNWSVTLMNISSGEYSWKMMAEAESNLTNETPTFYITVEKALPNFNLSINNKSENKTVYEDEQITINAYLIEGESNLSLYVNEELKNTSSNITLNNSFEPGNYTIQVVSEESDNYVYLNKSLNLEVKPLPLSLQISKNKIGLGESAVFAVNANQNSTVDLVILESSCNITNPWVVTVKEKTYSTSYPQTGDLFAQRAGTYCVLAELIGYPVSVKKEYVVENSLDIRVTGDTVLKPGQRSKLEAQAKGGLSPYTFKWVLDDGFKEVTGVKLEEIFEDKKTHQVQLIVEDSKGNTKTKNVEVVVKDHYKLTVIVRDDESNNILSGVDVQVEDEVKRTPSSGKVEFELPEGFVRVRAYADNYVSYDEDIDLDRNKELTIQLRKRTAQPTSSSTQPSRIQIFSPITSKPVTSPVEFKAQVDARSATICKLYVARQNAQWFEEIRSFNVQSKANITHTYEVPAGTHTFRIECESESSTFATQATEFTVQEAQTQTAQTQSGTFDAGSLREKIEQAQTNIDGLGFDDKRAAEALGLKDIVNRALRDFDRNLRDINSMMYRRDLTQDQINQRISDFTTNLESLEYTTPFTIETFGVENFVYYPKEEELIEVAEKYRDARNLVGNLDLAKLKRLQEKIVVRSQVITAQIQYIDGSTKDVTIVQKTIEYKEPSQRGEFIVESIPSSFEVTSSDVVEVLGEFEIITQNPLLRYSSLDNLTYYFDSRIDLSSAQNLLTVFFSESVYSTQISRNPITGFVTAVDVEFSTPVWSIIVLVVLILIYLAHAFDLSEKFIALFSKKNEKKIHQIKMLINDSNDYLDADNLERANLIFKEIKFNYEQSSEFVKQKVYEDAIKLHDKLNLKYVTLSLKELEKAVESKNQSSVVEQYNLVVDLIEELEPSVAKEVTSMLEQIKLKASQDYPGLFGER